MLPIAIATAFVVGGLYVRRHYGGAALAGLAVAATAVMGFIASGGFITMMRAIGVSSAGGEGAIGIAMIVLLQGGCYAGAALAIQLTRTDNGPWLTAWRFVSGIIGFVVGGALAFAFIMAVIVVGLAGMAK